MIRAFLLITGHFPPLLAARSLAKAGQRVSVSAFLLFPLPGSQSRRCPEAHRRGQPLNSEARNAKNAPESTICGAARRQAATTGSMPWLVPISFPAEGVSRRLEFKLCAWNQSTVDPFPRWPRNLASLTRAALSTSGPTKSKSVNRLSVILSGLTPSPEPPMHNYSSDLILLKKPSSPFDAPGRGGGLQADQA